MNNKEIFEQLLLTLRERVTPTLYFICTNTELAETKFKNELIGQLPFYAHYNLDIGNKTVVSLAETIRETLPEKILNSQPLQYIIHINGLESSLFGTENGKFAETSLPEEMNFERELLFNGFPFITILWSTQYFYKQIFRKAPDLVNWLINYFEFHTENEVEAPISELPVRDILPVKGATAERRTRIKQLENLMARLDRENPDQQKVLREKSEALSLLGQEYGEMYNWGKAEEYLKKALEIVQQTKNQKKAANIHFLLGHILLKRMKLKAALYHSKKCLTLTIGIKDVRNYGPTFHQIGMIYAEQHSWKEALENYLKAIEWKEKTDNQYEMGNTYHQIGVLYAEQLNWEEAMTNYRKAIEWYKKTDNLFQIGNTYHQIGMEYSEQQNWEEALTNYRKAIEWYEKTGNHFPLGGTYHEIGNVYSRQKKWEKAQENYLKAIEYDEKTGNIFELGGTFHQVGRAYEKQGSLKKAGLSYQKAVDSLQKYDHPFLPSALQSLQRIKDAMDEAEKQIEKS